ncbi:uncharacterized protein LOC115788710 isoform X1 [Archocentrus centrarchus]|uniref:uncharacterized protein LOC115788710 isoform X1 n=1 Tax=Archocentrus centrarchus TaxID=63155 RepID=UPI0011EA07D5|nr:uncharacterized protein LOC115788710 isoform X1 [Archocentrus centrarchus]
MSDTVQEKIKNYRTAPFDARFPNTNQTRNCFQNYLGKSDVCCTQYQCTLILPQMQQGSVSQRPGHSCLRVVPQGLQEPLPHRLGSEMG